MTNHNNQPLTTNHQDQYTAVSVSTRKVDELAGSSIILLETSLVLLEQNLIPSALGIRASKETFDDGERYYQATRS